jgi:hypothetical protein
MKPGGNMFFLGNKWADSLTNQPEAGMGYWIASIVLKSGQRYNQVIIDSGYVTKIRGMDSIPFTLDDIDQIIVTNDKWDWSKEK